MMLKELMFFSCILMMTTLKFADAQAQEYTTPVPILKQINRQNEDGSYSYGYEGADGSFKIETKYANGEVYGKYGYVDESGKTREVEYGASRRGFEPQGSDINVPPPTLTNTIPYPVGPNDVDDGQYHEDPSVYFKDEKFNKAPRLPATNFRLDNLQPNNNYNNNNNNNNRYNLQPQPQSQPQYHHHQQQQQQQPQQPQYHQQNQNQYYNPQPVYRPKQIQPPVQPYQQPTYYQQPNYYNNNNNNNGNNVGIQHHPSLRNLDLNSGSYSIDYTGRK